MGTLNQPGKYNCMEKLRDNPDLPYFLLLANDKRAPALVWLWATMLELDEGSDKDKVAEARQCCAEIMRWQAENGRRACGFGQAIMCGMMDMIRTINHVAREKEQKSDNDPTPLETMRLYLAAVDFGSPEQLKAAAEQAEALKVIADHYDGIVAGILPEVLANDGDEADFIITVQDYRILRAAALRAV